MHNAGPYAAGGPLRVRKAEEPRTFLRCARGRGVRSAVAWGHEHSDADLYDERGDTLDPVALQLHESGGRVAFDGPIRTVRCSRDNALVKAVLATPVAGAVLVIDGGGSTNGVGEVDGDVVIASVTFSPGRHVWADADGVLVQRPLDTA